MGRVTSQQFIFIGGDDNSRSAIGYNSNYNIGDNSNNGSFSRSISIKNNTAVINVKIKNSIIFLFIDNKVSYLHCRAE